MINPAEYIDQRIASVCCYCGDSNPLTVDHIPAKVFLDEPYPSQLPTVKACAKCNEKASMDEEYVACFLEALACGSTNDEVLERKKIVSALNHAPGLRRKIQDSLHFEETPCYTDVSEFFSRYRTIVEKSAIGFSRWYGGIVAIPVDVKTFLLDQLPAKSFEQFNNVANLHHEVYPEVASRLLHIIAETNSTSVKWEIFQPERFRVAIWQRTHGIEIRMVFREIAGASVFCTEFPDCRG